MGRVDRVLKCLLLFALTSIASSTQAQNGESPDSVTHSKQLEEVIISSVRASGDMPVTEFTMKRPEIKLNYTGQEMAVILARTPSFTSQL